MWLILLGFFSAVLAGLGLGGGMLLQPGLVLLFGETAAAARLTGLAAYLPMALAAFFVNIKNKKIKARALLYVVPAGMAGAVAGALLARVCESWLPQVYGVFFLIFGLVSFIFNLLGYSKKQKQKNMDI